MPPRDELLSPPAPAPLDGAGRSVFIGGPFKGLIDGATGLLERRARARYSALIDAFEADGWEVLSAHRAEAWGAELISDGACTRRDLAWMRACSVFVAFPGRPASPGTHVELGWASALGRATLVLVEPGAQTAALVNGLPEVAPVRLVEYRDEPECVREVVAMAAAALRADRRGQRAQTVGVAR